MRAVGWVWMLLGFALFAAGVVFTREALALLRGGQTVGALLGVGGALACFRAGATTQQAALRAETAREGEDG